MTTKAGSLPLKISPLERQRASYDALKAIGAKVKDSFADYAKPRSLVNRAEKVASKNKNARFELDYNLLKESGQKVKPKAEYKSGRSLRERAEKVIPPKRVKQEPKAQLNTRKRERDSRLREREPPRLDTSVRKIDEKSFTNKVGTKTTTYQTYEQNLPEVEYEFAESAARGIINGNPPGAEYNRARVSMFCLIRTQSDNLKRVWLFGPIAVRGEAAITIFRQIHVDNQSGYVIINVEKVQVQFATNR